MGPSGGERMSKKRFTFDIDIPEEEETAAAPVNAAD